LATKTSSKKARKPVSPFADSVPTLEFERGAGFPLSIVVGVDEVGRGCLAGPVVAAAVVLDPRRHIPGLADSKVVPVQERETLELSL